MITFRSFVDSTTSIVEDMLKMICLSSRHIEYFSHFMVNERSSNSEGRSLINSITNTS